MRIGGLASGMDIDQLVTDLMKAERIPMDKMEQKKQLLEWQRDDYREMNKLLFDLNNAAFDMVLSSNLKAKNVTSSDDSKVTATASPSAGNTTYSITKVGNLATSAYIVGAGDVTVNETDNLWTQRTNTGMVDVQWEETYDDVLNVARAGTDFKLSNQNIIEGTFPLDSATSTTSVIKVYQQGNLTADEYKITTDATNIGENEVYVNFETGEMKFGTALEAGSRIEASYKFYEKESKTVTEDSTTPMTLSQVGIAKIENNQIKVTDKDGNEKFYTRGTSVDTLTADQFYVNEDTGEITFGQTITKDSKIDVSYTYKTFDFSITTYDTSGNEVKETFNVDGKSTLNTVVSKINGSEVDVSSFYDEETQQFTLNRSQTGNLNENGKEMQLSGTFLSNVLQLDQVNELGGDDATFILNGLETNRHSNTFEVNGVTFTLKDTFDATPSATNPDAAVTISTTTDTDKVFENIKTFIEKYNEIIGKINDEINEERYRDYKPLTSAQREDMEEREIELWEERAKSGMLRNDSILENGLYQMRSNFYATVVTGGMYNNLTDIGITTSADYLSGGKLEINEAELKKALQNDPDAIYKLFAGDGTGNEQGIIRKLRDSVDGIMDRIENKAGNSGQTNAQFLLGKNLNDLEDRMDAFEDRLVQIEDRYWRQFTEMEKAIQRMNQQSMFLMNQFGGGM